MADTRIDPEAPVPNLTKARCFCLEALSSAPPEGLAGREISHAARDAGLNTKFAGVAEWADRHLSWLRQMGYAEHTGERAAASKLHRITPQGQKVLAQTAPP